MIAAVQFTPPIEMETDMRTQPKALIAALVLSLAVPLSAWAATHDGANRAAKGSTAAVAGLTDGEVRKVDAEEGKLTLRHGEIKDLDMPGMTMVFVVKDKTMLSNLKIGDKVKFKAINDAGKFTVTEIKPAE